MQRLLQADDRSSRVDLLHAVRVRLPGLIGAVAWIVLSLIVIAGMAHAADAKPLVMVTGESRMVTVDSPKLAVVADPDICRTSIEASGVVVTAVTAGSTQLRIWSGEQVQDMEITVVAPGTPTVKAKTDMPAAVKAEPATSNPAAEASSGAKSSATTSPAGDATSTQRSPDPAPQAGASSAPGIPMPTVLVSGTPLISPRPLMRVADEWFVPLEPVARALGATVELNLSLQTVEVRRADGLRVSYDGRTGEIKQGFMLLGRVPHPERAPVVVSRENFYFPVSGVVAMLGVDLREDLENNIIRIESAARGTAGTSGGGLSLGSVHYSTGATTNGDDFTTTANVTGDALIHGYRVIGSTVVNHYNDKRMAAVSHAQLRFEFSPKNALTFGNQGSFTGIEAFTNGVRGVGYEHRSGKSALQFYGGQAISSTVASLGLGVPQYDTWAGGFALHRATADGGWDFAGNGFQGKTRWGGALGVGFGKSTKKNQLKIEGLFGRFQGDSSRTLLIENPLQPNPDPLNNIIVFTSKPIWVDGFGGGLTFTDTLNPVSWWSVTGRVQHYTRNFLTFRDDPQYNGRSSQDVSTTVRPVRYLSFSGSVGRAEYLLGDRDYSRTFTYGANGSLPGRLAVQLGYFHSESLQQNSSLPGVKLDQFSALIPRLWRVSVSSYYSTVDTAGSRFHSFSGMAALDVGRVGRLEYHQQEQFGQSRRMGGEYDFQLRSRIWLRAGADRLKMTGNAVMILPTAGLRLGMPFGQQLQFSFSAQPGTFLMQVEMNGDLLRHREISMPRSTGSPMVVTSDLVGRVYADVNQNGRFDPGVDRGIRGVRLMLDGTMSAITDGQGTYRFDHVSPGAHKLQGELDGIPADMVFATSDVTVAVRPYGLNLQDFRVLRTGRVEGTVRFAGRVDGVATQMPLRDVRVVIADKDGLTEYNGSYLIGDLPPRTYRVSVDRNSVPDGYMASPASRTIEVKAGAPTQDVNFDIVERPKQVVERELPAQNAASVNSNPQQ